MQSARYSGKRDMSRIPTLQTQQCQKKKKATYLLESERKILRFSLSFLLSSLYLQKVRVFFIYLFIFPLYLHSSVVYTEVNLNQFRAIRHYFYQSLLIQVQKI